MSQLGHEPAFRYAHSISAYATSGSHFMAGLMAGLGCQGRRPATPTSGEMPVAVRPPSANSLGLSPRCQSDNTTFLDVRHSPERGFFLLRPCFDLRQGRLALKRLLFRRRGQQSLSDRLLTSELASPANGLGFLASLLFRWLFIGAPPLHFSEDALALHLFLENTERLLNIVVSDKYVQLIVLAWGCECDRSCMAANCAGASLPIGIVAATLAAWLGRADLHLIAMSLAISTRRAEAKSELSAGAGIAG
jgi:hypothetical protein